MGIHPPKMWAFTTDWRVVHEYGLIDTHFDWSLIWVMTASMYSCLSGCLALTANPLVKATSAFTYSSLQKHIMLAQGFFGDQGVVKWGQGRPSNFGHNEKNG